MADQGDEEAEGLENVSDPVESETASPPAIMPDNEDVPSDRRRPKWLVPVIVAVAAVVLIVAGLVGWRVVESRQHDAALDSCNRAVKTLQEKTGSARMASYREAAGVNAGQVKDASTVLAMARSVKNAEGLKQPTIQCKASMSTGDLNTEAGKAKKLDSKYEAVAKAAKAVLASRDTKALEDAKAALDGKKDEASKLLGDSDGRVADNATRDSLKQAIDKAGQIKGDEAKAYQDAASALQAAIDQVNASMQAKSQADQQAAAQAAQQQDTTQRQPSYRPSGNRGRYQPAQAPAPSSPHQGGSLNIQDYPNLWEQLQKGDGGPAIDNQGNCIANCYGWTGSN